MMTQPIKGNTAMAATITVAVFDHKSTFDAKSKKLTRGPVASVVGHLKDLGVLPFDVAFLKDLESVQKYRIAIIHVATKETWEAACVPYAGSAGYPTIRIRASTKGRQSIRPDTPSTGSFPGGRPEEDDSCEPCVTETGVVCLCLHRPCDAQENAPSAADWNRIFDALQDSDLPARMMDSPDKWPDAIRTHFCCPPVPSVLSALVILCQGYLVVQVRPDVIPEVDDPEGKIAAAIEDMEWHKVLSSDEVRRSLDPRLTVGTAAARAERDGLREMVAKPSFWDVFTESENEKEPEAIGLKEDAQKQWDAIPGLVIFNTSSTAELVEYVERREKIDDATLVAKAYLELAKKLGGTDAS